MDYSTTLSFYKYQADNKLVLNQIRKLENAHLSFCVFFGRCCCCYLPEGDTQEQVGHPLSSHL